MTKDEIEYFILETCPEGGEVFTGWESGYDWKQVIKIATAAYNLGLKQGANEFRKEALDTLNKHYNKDAD